MRLLHIHYVPPRFDTSLEYAESFIIQDGRFHVHCECCPGTYKRRVNLFIPVTLQTQEASCQHHRILHCAPSSAHPEALSHKKATSFPFMMPKQTLPVTLHVLSETSRESKRLRERDRGGSLVFVSDSHKGRELATE